MQDRPLRPEWLPILQKLGFPVPTTPHENLQTPKRAAAVVAGCQWPRCRRGLWTQPCGSMAAGSTPSATGWGSAAVRCSSGCVCPGRPICDLKSRASFFAAVLVARIAPARDAPADCAAHTDRSTDSAHWPSPDGAWLAKERRRLRLTEYDACRALQVNARMLRRIEREADALAKAWFPALRALGLAVDVARG